VAEGLSLGGPLPAGVIGVLLLLRCPFSSLLSQDYAGKVCGAYWRAVALARCAGKGRWRIGRAG